MTFLVNGIKEGLDKKFNIEFLLGVNSSLLAKKFLEHSGIITLSLKEYQDEDKSFGNVYFTVNYLQQDITLVSKVEGELTEFCLFLFDMGFKVNNINFLDNPLPEEEIKTILQTAKEESQKKTEEIEKAIEVKKEETRKIYTDERLGADKETIERIFTKIHEVIELTKGFIGGKELKLLSEKEDELKKLKLGTNHERITELTNETLDMLEIMENDYYAANTNKEEALFEGTKVTNVDFKKEVNKREKVQKLKEVGSKIKSKDQDYMVFGKYTMFPKFLLKDLKNLFSSPKKITTMLYNIYDLVELGVITVLFLIQVYILADVIFLFSGGTNYELFYQRIIKIGVFGVLLRAARTIRKKDMFILIVLIPAIILLYALFIYIINNNFSI